MVVSAGTDRSLNILDLNAGRSVGRIEDAHAKPVHRIRLNAGSRHVDHPPESYNFFFTAAVLDGIRLWDLRSQQMVRRFAGAVASTSCLDHFPALCEPARAV